MEVDYQDLPDERWRRAAAIALSAWNTALTRSMSARVVLRPWRSPDGAAVPYLVRGEATRADGAPAFGATAVVLNDALANARGAAAATAVLAAAGFPAQQISLGHLLDVLYLTSAIESSWLQPPSVVGWDRAGKPDRLTQMAPSLEYASGRAVLHLHRVVAPVRPSPSLASGASGASGPGGPPPRSMPPGSPSGGPPPGSTPPGSPSGGPPPGSMPPLGPDGRPRTTGGGLTLPDVERLDVSFDDQAAFTTTRLRRNAAQTSWEVVP